MTDLRTGDLEVRLADSAAAIEAAQALRFRVFYQEMAAVPTAEMAANQRDFDSFDPYCDHLLAIDHSRGSGAEAVVGTYRLLRRDVAERHGGFYSAAEYDLSNLLRYPGEIMELGRSCVDAAYRNRSTVQLLWRGISAYVFEHRIGLMFGCASLPGVDPQALAVPLSYLYHYHLAPAPLCPRALPDRYVSMDLLAKEKISPRAALSALPPLIKGYLRLGGFVGEGAVIDSQFNTTDVCIVVELDRVTGKYSRHYERTARDQRMP